MLKIDFCPKIAYFAFFFFFENYVICLFFLKTMQNKHSFNSDLSIGNLMSGKILVNMNKDDFLHDDKHQSFLQAGSMVFTGHR